MRFSLRGNLKWGTILAAAILALILAAPALADYLGPDRAVTTWSEQRLVCQYVAAYPTTSPTDHCTLSLYYIPSATCPDPDSVRGYFQQGSTSCGDWPTQAVGCPQGNCQVYPGSWLEPCSAGDYGCESIPTTVTYPEAAISGSLQGCTLQNGWCVTNSTLVLTGTEPVAGQRIIGIEGTLNGQGFGYPFLPGAAVESASVPLGEGVNTLTFWALSSWGDSSQRGTFSANVDTQPPAINGSASGILGDNGWYISTASVSATASDAASGVATFEYTLDGTAWAPYAGPLMLAEGSHSIDFQATDVAGHTYSISQAVNVDTEPPQASLAGNPSFCPGCGEVVDLAFSAQDATSGIATWELVVDGTSILASGMASTDQSLAWNGSGLPDGDHSLVLEAHDVAGNVVEATLDVTILLPPPPVEDSGSDSTAPQFVAGPVSLLPTRMPVPARPDPRPTTVSFGSPATEQPVVEDVPADEGVMVSEGQPPSTVSGPPSVLWGAAAAGLLGAVTAYAIEQKRKREEEEEQKAAIAAAFNADQRAADAGLDAKIAAAVVAKQAQSSWGLTLAPSISGKRAPVTDDYEFLKDMPSANVITRSMAESALRLYYDIHLFGDFEDIGKLKRFTQQLKMSQQLSQGMGTDQLIGIMPFGKHLIQMMLQLLFRMQPITRECFIREGVQKEVTRIRAVAMLGRRLLMGNDTV